MKVNMLCEELVTVCKYEIWTSVDHRIYRPVLSRLCDFHPEAHGFEFWFKQFTFMANTVHAISEAVNC